jgi:hypothetical protein
VTEEKSKAREKETSGPVNGQQSFWRHNSQMFSTYSDRHVATQGRQRRRLRRTRRDGTEQVDTVSVDDGEMTGDGVRTVRRRRRRCDGSSRRAYMEHRRATSTAKDDRMIARGGRHRMSEIRNGQNYRRVGSRSLIETNVRVLTFFQLNVSTQTHRARPRVLASREISHSRGPKESKSERRERATERKGNTRHRPRHTTVVGANVWPGYDTAKFCTIVALSKRICIVTC